MTTFHDPQPLSRRAVRQGERGEPVIPPVPSPVSASEPQRPYRFDPSATAEPWTTSPRRAAQAGQPQSPYTGRRAQRATPPEQATQQPYPAPAAAAPLPVQPPFTPPPVPAQAAQPEPLSYITQGRPQVPSYDGPSFRGPVPPVDVPAPVPSALQQPHVPRQPQEQPQQQAPQQASPPVQESRVAYRERDFSPEGRREAMRRELAQQQAGPADYVPAAGSELNYQTQVSVPTEVPERTISRRELREARAAAERVTEIQMPESIETLLHSGPIDLPVPQPLPGQSQVLADAMAEFDALTKNSRGRRAETQDSSPVVDSVDPVFVEPVIAPAKPSGHWSLQAAEDDGLDFTENTITRSVGSAPAITTNALVLPSLPKADFTSPLSATGEVLLTGSINLPFSLGSRGALPHRIDNSDFDEDPLDREIQSTDSAPVSAIRAVSTHTSSRDIILSKKPKSTRMLTVMFITVGVLAVAVTALLVIAAHVLKVF